MSESKNKWSMFDILCAIILGSMFLVVLAQIISRYVFRNVIVWSDELAKFLLIYVAMFGAVVAEERGNNVRFTFIVDHLPRIAKLIVNAIVDLIIVAFYLIAIVYGIRLMMETHYMKGVSLPMVRWSYIYACLPVTFSTLLCMHMKRSLAVVKDFLRGLPESNEDQIP